MRQEDSNVKPTHLIKPILDGNYPTVQYGKGVYLYDKNNKEYLDGSSGAVTASLGHGVSDIKRAMEKQASKISFVYRSQFTSDPAEELAKKLCDLTSNRLDWVFFVNSGSEATETAMKIAIQHFQEQGKSTKNKVISRWISYHGITMGSLSMSGHKIRRERFLPLLDDLPNVCAPYCYRCPFQKTFPACNLHCADELETSIRRIGEDSIAAFIAEPVIGASGAAITPPKGYYNRVKEICEKYNILFIVDEVMTGIGRTGKVLAIDHWDVTPDIVALGKGMSAGYSPIAATLVTNRVLEPILQGSKIIMSGHTYSANPQSAAISLAVLKYIEDHNILKNSRKKGKYLTKQLRRLAKDFSWIGDIRGKGLLLGIEFVANLDTKQSFYPPSKVTNLVIQKAMEHGLLVYPASAGFEGVTGDAIIIAPPLVIKKKEIDDLIFRLKKALEDTEGVLIDEGMLSP